MRRRVPNPWVMVPVLVGFVVGGIVGWSVMTVGCRPDGCPTAATLVGIGAALLTATGVLVVAVLAIRSLSEWQEASAGREPASRTDEMPPEN